MKTNMIKSMKYICPAISAFLLTMASAVSSYAPGFFVQPVSEQLNVGHAAFTIYFSLMTASGTLASPVIGRFIKRFGVVPVLMASGIWSFTGHLLLANAKNMIDFYIIGFLMGLLCGSAMGCSAGIIVQRSYNCNVGKMMGLVVSGSALGGMIFSKLLPYWIATYGWRNGYRITGIYWLILIVLAIIILIWANPSGRKIKKDIVNNTYVKLKYDRYLILLFLSGFTLALTYGLLQHMPALLHEENFSLAASGNIMAMFTVFTVVGKILQGFIYDKFDIMKSSRLISILYIAGFILIALPERASIYLAIPFIAIGIGKASIFLPLAAGRLYKSEYYAAAWGIINASASMGNLIGTPLWGLAYDWSGSYFFAIILSPFMLILALIFEYISLKSVCVNRQ